MILVSLFWAAIGMMVYVYVGFPALTWVRSRVRPMPVAGSPITPHVTLIIVAHNEADVIQSKLENALQLDYPPQSLEIIVASDGSDDGTIDIVRRFTQRPVRLLDLPRRGKNPTLNDAVAAANGEILIFTDADSMLENDSIRQLVAPFADPAIGGVAGDYHYCVANREGLGEASYWNYDRHLKKMQSTAGSVTSATGQIYAVRRKLFQPVPDGVTDDAYVSRSVIGQQHRLIFNPAAVASGPIADPDGEYRRKIRVTTRGLNTVWQQRELLDPRRTGYFAWQLFSHKILRRLMGIPVLLIALVTPFLWKKNKFYRLAAVGQMVFHGAALLGFATRDQRLGRQKLLSLPFHFDMVNFAALRAVGRLLRGQSFDVWQAERGGSPSDQEGHGE